MTALYFSEGADSNSIAFSKQAEAKAFAKSVFDKHQKASRVLRVELNNALGARELMCALFNNATDSFVTSKEVIFTAGPRTRRTKAEMEAAEAAEAAPEAAEGDEFAEAVATAEGAPAAAEEDANEFDI